MAWIDYRKAFDSVPHDWIVKARVPHDWIVKALELYKISPVIIIFENQPYTNT